jgi:membrane protein implicated in regulation of membrane protease activity
VPSSLGGKAMVDEIVFWLICAIAAAGVWWAFFGRRHHPPP